MVLKAALAAGLLCFGSPESDTLEPALDAVVGLATNKAEEVQFAAGEALCYIFGGTPITGDSLLYTHYVGLANWMERNSKQPENDASSLPSAPITASHAQESIQDRILTKILDDLIFNSRPEVRSVPPGLNLDVNHRLCDASNLTI